jgi:hypothetical protein
LARIHQLFTIFRLLAQIHQHEPEPAPVPQTEIGDVPSWPWRQRPSMRGKAGASGGNERVDLTPFHIEFARLAFCDGIQALPQEIWSLLTASCGDAARVTRIEARIFILSGAGVCCGLEPGCAVAHPGMRLQPLPQLSEQKHGQTQGGAA